MDLAVREVLRPASVGEALALLAARPDAAPLAGGTDLLVQLRDGRRPPSVLVDLSGLRLTGITVSEDGAAIGAATAMDAIAADPRIRRLYPALAAGAASVGAWPIQCRATLAGNLVNASPAADTAPPLLVEGATLLAASAAGERRVALEDFFVAPGRTALAPGELILRVTLPPPPAAAQGRLIERFVKVGPRREQVVSVVSLAGRVLVRADGTLARVRLALGSVAPTPLRAHATERLLEGRLPGREARYDAVTALQAEIAPIDDLRASARYRRIAAAVVLDRFLAEAERG